MLSLVAHTGVAAAQPGASAAAPAEELVVVKRPNPYLAVGGLIVGGTAYGGSLATSVLYLALVFPFQAAAGCDDPADTPLQLAIPIAGPLIAADGQKGNLRTLFYVDAGMQAVGLLMIGSAFVFQQEVLVKRERRRAGYRPSFAVGGGPRGSLGLSIAGAF